MLYTLEWMPPESSFYFILNKALCSQNRHELLPWFLFLRLFIFALSKIPSTKHRIVYRGIKMDMSDEFLEGKTFIWWAFSSCSSSIKVLEQSSILNVIQLKISLNIHFIKVKMKY
jgi:hypothetical protein